MGQDDRRTPPTPTGRELVTFDRGGGKVLRVSLNQYEGHDYIGVRLFDGGYPTKTGCSFRLSELPNLVQTLSGFIDTFRDAPTQGGPARGRPEPRGDLRESRPGLEKVHNCGRDDRPQFVDRHRRTEPVSPERRSTFPTPARAEAPFDEF